MIYQIQMDMSVALIAIILLSGIVAYARLKLNAHTPSQVYSGFVLGFFIELGLMLFY